MVASNKVHCCSGDPLVKQNVAVGSMAEVSADYTFLDAFRRFLLFAINQKRVHLGAKTNKLLDWLACGLILHLAKNLKAIEFFELNVQFVYRLEFIPSC